MRFEPAAMARSISSSLSAFGKKPGSFCSPSRAATSTISMRWTMRVSTTARLLRQHAPDSLFPPGHEARAIFDGQAGREALVEFPDRGGFFQRGEFAGADGGEDGG